MKHSFRFKTSVLKTIFKNKLEFKTLSIDKDEDVFNSINTLLGYTDLDEFLLPVDCSYNYLNNAIEFCLALKPEKDKKEFFKSIKQFEDFIEI